MSGFVNWTGPKVEVKGPSVRFVSPSIKITGPLSKAENRTIIDKAFGLGKPKSSSVRVDRVNVYHKGRWWVATRTRKGYTYTYKVDYGRTLVKRGVHTVAQRRGPKQAKGPLVDPSVNRQPKPY